MRVWQWRAIGVLTLGGSFLGLVLTLITVPGVGNLLSKFIASIFVGLYAWGVWCGMGMLERSVDTFRKSILFWAFQIPYFTSPLLSYNFSSGARATVALQTADPQFLWTVQLGSHFAAMVLRPAAWGIGVNLLALVVTVFLSYKYRAYTSQQNEMEIHVAAT